MIKRIFLGVILFIYIILLFFSACTSLTKKQPHISHVRQMDEIFKNYDDNFLPNQKHRKRPWGPTNNPFTALKEFLSENNRFQIDQEIESKLLFSCNPSGYLKAKK